MKCNGNFDLLEFHCLPSDCNKFMHMSRQHCCRVLCAKFCCDHYVRIELRLKRNFSRILIAMEKTLVECAQGKHLHLMVLVTLPRLEFIKNRVTYSPSPDLNLTPLAAFLRFCRAQLGKKSKKAARGIRFKSGLRQPSYCMGLYVQYESYAVLHQNVKNVGSNRPEKKSIRYTFCILISDFFIYFFLMKKY